MDSRSFTINGLQEFLNLSRGAIRHYESIGLLTPARDEESGYRIYSNKDAYTVLDYLIYQNCGGSSKDAQQLLAGEGVPADEFIDRCGAEVRRNLAWYRAVEETVQRLGAIGRGECTGEPRLVVDDVWWLYYDRGELGYGSFEANGALDALVKGMPVSSLGAVFDGDFFATGKEEPRWHRTVPERHAGLLPDLGEHEVPHVRLGGTLSLVCAHTARVGSGSGFDDDYATRAQVKAYMERHGLVLAGTPFLANSWPICEAFYIETHVPVRAFGPFAGLRQAVLERRAPRYACKVAASRAFLPASGRRAGHGRFIDCL